MMFSYMLTDDPNFNTVRGVKIDFGIFSLKYSIKLSDWMTTPPLNTTNDRPLLKAERLSNPTLQPPVQNEKVITLWRNIWKMIIFFPLPLPALACVFRSRICECVNQIWSWLQEQEHTPMFPDAPLQQYNTLFFSQPMNRCRGFLFQGKKIINVIAPSTHEYNSPIPPSSIATS